jgi:hypothetical protein
MRSRQEADRIDLEAGISATKEDTLALRRTRLSNLAFENYLDFLDSFEDADRDTLAGRKGPGGTEKFEF